MNNLNVFIIFLIEAVIHSIWPAQCFYIGDGRLFFYHFNCVFVLCCMLLQSCSRGTLLTNISNYIDNLIIKIILIRKPKLILKHLDYQNVVLSCKTHLQFENR